MLQGISGALEMMDRRLQDGRFADLPRLLEAGQEGVKRAAALTHGLLAFARRGHLDAKPIVVDEVVEGMADFVQRTVGPGIEVRLRLRDGTWKVRLDRSGLESALLNLAINARDAMRGRGRLTFATRELSLSAEDLGTDADSVLPGAFVQISVADTGEGMSQEVLTRVFEPFFTTKPIGQGTGLGLSQIYGFVRQSGGLVRIESVVGAGTTIRLYLPRYLGKGGEETAQIATTVLVANNVQQTVVLVEDEDTVRAFVAEALRARGHTVLEAEDGPSGLRLLSGAARVDLLVTDVGLPGLNGRQMADAARERRPMLPVLFITGYAGNALDEALPTRMAVIAKPFSLDQLAERVEAMLATATNNF
jgi:CheY-like chemotaxis protein